MPLKVNCPSCQKTLAVNESLAGKRVKCPKCAGKIIVPLPAAKPRDDIFALADEPQEAAPPKPKPGQKKAASDPKTKPPEPGTLPKGETPYYEVLDSKSGRVDRYESDELVEALVEATITRKHMARIIEHRPVLTKDMTPQTQQEAMERWALRRQWRPIGNWVARDDAAVRRLYEEVDYGPFAGFIGAGLLFVIAFFFTVVPRWSPEVTEETVERAKEELLDGAKRRVLPRRSADFLTRISMSVVSKFIDEDDIVAFTRVLAIVMGLCMGLVMGIIGFGVGFTIGWLLTYFGVLEPKRPPDDGFDPTEFAGIGI